jgi:hypothetical protein
VFVRNAYDDCFIDVQWSDEGDMNTQYRDKIMNSDDLNYYCDHYTWFHYRNTPHCVQELDCDHLRYHPTWYGNLVYGLTCFTPYNCHTSIAYGSIRDIFPNYDSRWIDYNEITDPYIISGVTAAHELGHSLAFYEQSSQKNMGHVSGPGVMWSSEGCECSLDPEKKPKRKSSLWGDHVFVLRFDPDI